MTRKEWRNAPKNEKGWSKHNKARRHFSLCKLGKIIILHHKNPQCVNYEEWNIDELVPMFSWCHSYMHSKWRSIETLKTFLGNRKGQHHTVESRKKMSVSHTGTKWSEKRRETYEENGMVAWNKGMKGLPGTNTGRVFNEEARKRMSDAHKGQIPPSRKGIKHSIETKKKLSEALRGNQNARKEVAEGGVA